MLKFFSCGATKSGLATNKGLGFTFKELNKISCHTVSHWSVPSNINEFISSNISMSCSSSKQLMLGMLNLLSTLPKTPKGPSG